MAAIIMVRLEVNMWQLHDEAKGAHLQGTRRLRLFVGGWRLRELKNPQVTTPHGHD